jgi:hypothetical protein
MDIPRDNSCSFVRARNINSMPSIACSLSHALGVEFVEIANFPWEGSEAPTRFDGESAPVVHQAGDPVKAEQHGRSKSGLTKPKKTQEKTTCTIERTYHKD